MLKRLSQRAQRLILVLAPEEAQKLSSDKVEPEHLILALLKSADGLGYNVLQDLRINVLTLQLSIEQTLPKNKDFAFNQSRNINGKIPNSERFQEILRKASLFSDELKLDYMGSEHLLYACVDEKDSLLNQYFAKANITKSMLIDSVCLIEKKHPTSAAFTDESNSLYKNFEDDGSVPFMSDGRSFSKQRTSNFLQQYCRDLTDEAINEKLDPMIGRDKECERVVQILCRRTKNNPVLVGEPGVGKTAIVEGLALRIAQGNIPRELYNKRVLVLDLGSLIAGTRYRGEFEERMKRIMKEIKQEKNIILFIDEVHTIIGAGGPEGAMDASNMIKPALSRGELQIIGATTSKEYRKYFEKDSALVRRFQKIMVEEPSLEESEEILFGLKKHYEDFHHVIYEDEVIPLIVKYSNRYVQERFLPDKAIDILDEAGSAKKINGDNRPFEIEELEQTIAELNEEKRTLVNQQNYEEAAYIRDKVASLKKELDSIRLNWKNTNNANRRVVTKADVLKIISQITGIDVNQLDDDESAKLLKMEEELHKIVVGQDEAISVISSSVRRSKAGVSSPKRPMGSFIFLGPTGVGKTQLAKALAKYLFGSEDSLIRVDMSDYMEKQNASRLVGAPPGYVGFEEGGVLTEKVRNHPYSVVLLDEIEKAHHDIYNLLLQLLEEGELKDNLGHTVSFRNTIVLMTSNAGAREITAESRVGFSTGKQGILPHEEIKASAMEELKRIMSPELLNRIDDVIVFESLTKEQIKQILFIQLQELENRLSEQNIVLTIKPKAIEYFAENGYEPTMGARPLRRLIQKEIEDPVAMLLLSPRTKDDNEIVIDFNGEKVTQKFKSSKAKTTKTKTVKQEVLVEE